MDHVPLNAHLSPTDADRDALLATDFEESSKRHHDKDVHEIDSSSESDGLYDTDLEEEFPGELTSSLSLCLESYSLIDLKQRSHT